MILIDQRYEDPVHEEQFRPRFVCDVCQQPINQIGGNYVVANWEKQSEGDASVDPLDHVHGDQCFSAAKAKHGGNVYFEKLEVHIEELLRTVGLDIQLES
jgi:hypothetical protein